MKIIKRNNNKAYTIMEVLAVIILIGIILIITFPLITNAIIKSKYRYYESQENTLLLAGRDYFTDNRTRLPKAEEEEKTISLQTLVNEGYTKPILDISKDGCNQDETAVTVKRLGKGEYRYYVRLKCNDYDTDDTWEWSDWSFNEPGFDTEYEVATVYNFQTPTIVKGEWGPWEYITAYQDNDIIPISKEGKVEQLEPEVEYQTVYQYRDQFWKWYKGGEETSACSSSTPGTGWIKSSPCQWNWSHTVCATSKDGYTKGTECRWNWSRTVCQGSDPGGYTKGTACGYTTETSSCVASNPWSDGTKGSACGWTTKTENYSGCPPGTTSWCTCWLVGQLRNQGWTCTTRPIYRAYGSTTPIYLPCTSQNNNDPYIGELKGFTVSNLGYDLPLMFLASGTCYPHGVNGWKTKKINTYTSGCYYIGSGGCSYLHETSCQGQCYKTTQVASKWYFSRQVANKWNWSKTSCDASSPGTGFNQGAACYWNWTKTACAASIPGTGYVQGAPCSWLWKKDTVVYADGYHATKPEGYSDKDSDKYIYTDWSEPSTTPPPTQDNRTIEPRKQKRSRTVTATWQGNRLTKWLKLEPFKDCFKNPTEWKNACGTVSREYTEVENDALINIVSATVYRYKIKTY
ncbi:MAG: hypothetical protein ACOXZW_03290 [Bacilli bacterium]|jgi:type II secretory pathway pseudopilin PulG